MDYTDRHTYNEGCTGIGCDLKVENAVDNMIYSWDRDTLMNFAFDNKLEYYLEHADQTEINKLLKEFG